MTAPERIWARPDYNECWPKRLEEEDVEYIRADLAALEPQPAPHDEVIARLVEAAEHLLRNYLQDELDEPDLCVDDDHWTAIHDVDAALAAAKAVQHD